MSNAMPKFDFSKASIKSNAELEALTKRTGVKEDTSSVMRPGSHEVTIANVEYTGMAQGDSSWAKYKVTYQGTGNKRIISTILVPTSDILYGEKRTAFPFKKLRNLVSSLGRQLNVETLSQDLAATFGNPDSLKGLHVVVKVGYERAHVKFSKGTGKDPIINIVLKGGNLLSDASGNALAFPSVDAAEAHMDQNGIAYDSFPSVLGYEKSSTSNDSTGSNW